MVWLLWRWMEVDGCDAALYGYGGWAAMPDIISARL